MKKLLSLLLIAVLGFTVVACADDFKNDNNQSENNNFAADNQAITSVAQAMEMGQDVVLTLQGYIVKRFLLNYYVFKDSSGEFSVEIDDKLWQGRTITPSTKIQITGQPDTYRFKATDFIVTALQFIPNEK